MEKSSVRDLGEAKIALLKEKGRLRRDFDVDDLTVYKVLNRSGFDKADIPAEGARVNLLESASLSTGGEAIDLSDAIHPEFAELAIKACGAVGLKFAGGIFWQRILPNLPRSKITRFWS
jgi:D-alanine-D-alanine ligase-like ATP-grasp enzyme